MNYRLPPELIDQIAFNLPFNYGIELSAFLKYKLKEYSGNNSWKKSAHDGNLFGLEWMHFHKIKGCSIHAMNVAAELGWLEIVKWLHSNRKEGCTLTAMN
jgi:hypothetical protein